MKIHNINNKLEAHHTAQHLGPNFVGAASSPLGVSRFRSYADLSPQFQEELWNRCKSLIDSVYPPHAKAISLKFPMRSFAGNSGAEMYMDLIRDRALAEFKEAQTQSECGYISRVSLTCLRLLDAKPDGSHMNYVQTVGENKMQALEARDRRSPALARIIERERGLAQGPN